MDYWKKLASRDRVITDLLEWGIPEQKSGKLTVVGGSSQNFSTEIRCAEYLNSLPLKSVQLLLPESLRGKLPPVPGVDFVSSTDSGSIARSALFESYATHADFLLILGDVTKNSETSVALSSMIKSISPSLSPNSVANPHLTASPGSSSTALLNSISASSSDTPLLLTRDAVDSLSDSAADFIERQNLFLVASLAQLQKLFRALLYPKMLLLSSPLMPVIETLHKFTLTYEGLTLLTFHSDQIIIASRGIVATIPIKDTSYSPLSLWSGTLASKISVMNLWNPGHPLDTTAAAVFKD